MTIPNDFRTDPLGRREDLRSALASPLLVRVAPNGTAPAGAPEAAYRLAVALGFCRLCGLTTDELPQGLPVHLAHAAARWLTGALPEWIEQSARLGADWDNEPIADDADRLVADTIETRTNVWAASVVLTEARLAAGTDEVVAVALTTELDRLDGLVNGFDEALERHTDILSTLVGTPRWEWWRAPLVGEYRSPFPWWLGDTVLTAAERLRGPVVALSEPAEKVLTLARFLPEVVGSDVSVSASPLKTGATHGGVRVWVHPAETYTMELSLPAVLTHAEANRERLVNFYRPDGALATELAKQVVQFGAITLTVSESGQFRIKLIDLPADRWPRLVVNGIEWLPQPEATDGQ